MDTIEKLHNSTDFNNLTYHYKGPKAKVDLNNFIDVAILFDEIKSKRIKSANAKKIKWNFKSRLSNMRIGVKKLDKQENEIKNITNFLDAHVKVIKFYKD